METEAFGKAHVIGFFACKLNAGNCIKVFKEAAGLPSMSASGCM
jgi:hypothetical protein